MSIYPIRLSEWYPKGDENYEIAKVIVESEHCRECGEAPLYRWAIGDHSLPWGHHRGVWCSKKCFNGKGWRPTPKR